MDDLKQRIADLSPEKRVLLEQQLLQGMRASRETRAIPRRAPAETYPLSHTQRRLWFLAQFDPESAAYNIPNGLRLRGPLDANALRESLDALVMRHESLRTTFRILADGSPAQAIAPSATMPWNTLDLSALPETERETELARTLKRECRRPFDLARDLMLRALLVRLGPEDHVLLLVAHHIASDGFSAAILRRELFALYSARIRHDVRANKEALFLRAPKAAPALPELPIQYADFACWQQSDPQQEATRRQLAYWKQQLGGAPQELELPSDRPRPAIRTDAGARVGLELSGELVRSLGALSRRQGVTLFMTLLAGFDLLLHRYSGAEDLLVGTPIANRTRSETEGLIGFFANTLVLRADLSGDPTFLDFLGRVRKTALEAYAHQDAPFDLLVEALHPARDLGRLPLIQVAFALQRPPPVALLSRELDVQQIPLDPGSAKFDLLLNMTESPAGLSGWFEYSTDLLEQGTIERMAGQFRVLLEAIAADPGRRLSELPLLTEAERRRILVDWNATAANFPKDRCLHQLFEEQVKRTPEAVAVAHEERELSYGELNARANRLAHYLREAGVRPDGRVAICMERGIEMVVGLLAVLKAGGAYVPLDPAYPAERLSYMLEDSAPTVLLTQGHLKRLFGARSKALSVIDLAADSPPWANQPASNPDRVGAGLTPEHLAYVIYTSGSTGKPKGVAIEHRNAVNFVCWAQSAVAGGELERTLFSTSLNFDLAVYECFVPLAVGATVRIVRDALALAGARADVTLINTTPSVMAALVEAGGVPRTVRRVNLAGEPLKRALAERIFAATEAAAVCNLYGPTETTTYSTGVTMRRGEAFAPHIGRPIANTRIYILDGHGQVVPIGVAGEIHIGGAGVARGYLNRPDLTAERFVRDPFSPDAGARMYKTGDLGRWLPAGTIEFLGRNDFQVKVRGFRIELGEIEAALCRHPAVKEAVVVVREDAPEIKSLAAYVTARPPRTPSATELRQFLEKTLPGYMVPATFTPMDSIPLTPNGKVDRKALPAPVHAGTPDAKRVAPRGVVERELVRMWQALFNVPAVGVQDNFFDLGGHSLLAVRLFARVEEVLGKKLPLITLFQAPTIEKMARAVRGEAQAEGFSSLVGFQSSGSRIPLFCVAPVDPFEYAQLARRLGPEQPFYVFHPADLVEAEIPDISVEALAARYIRELQSVQPAGPYMLGGLCAGGMIAYEMAQQLRAQGETVALLVLLDTPFPGSNRPARKPGYLALRMLHHIAVFCGLKSKERMEYIRTRWATLKRGGVRRPAPAEGPSPVAGAVESPMKGIRVAYRYVLPEYVPKPYGGRIALFLAAESRKGLFTDSRKKWRRLATGKVELHVVPGAHQHMLLDPHADLLAAKLRDCLIRAQPSPR